MFAISRDEWLAGKNICEDMKMEDRTLSVDEAEQFWSLMNQLDYETKYMLYEPGERTKNLSDNRVYHTRFRGRT